MMEYPKLTMEEAKNFYPNMLTVLQCYKQLLKDNVTVAIMQRDHCDASCVYVDTDVDYRTLIEYYMPHVPESVWDSDIGLSIVLPIDDLKVTSDPRLFDVTEVAKEVWSEVQ